MTREEEIAELKEQLREALEWLSVVEGENQALQEQLAAAQKRIEELEKQKKAPEFVKARVVKPTGEEKKQKILYTAEVTVTGGREGHERMPLEIPLMPVIYRCDLRGCPAFYASYPHLSKVIHII